MKKNILLHKSDEIINREHVVIVKKTLKNYILN